MTKLLSKRTVAAAWCSCVLAAVLLCAGVAWADEGQESSKPNNHVYVNQLSDSSFLYQTTIADLLRPTRTMKAKQYLCRAKWWAIASTMKCNPTIAGLPLQDDDPQTLAWFRCS